MTMKLSPKEKQALKAKAHALKPIILIGAKGLTDNVLNEIEIALKAHELIKIKIAGQDKTERTALAVRICEHADAEHIQQIGNILVIYKENLDK